MLDSFASQEDTFRIVAAPMVPSMFEGKSCAILCYGQTGSGKTYTMMGPPLSNSSPGAPLAIASPGHVVHEDGIAQRFFKALFADRARRPTSEGQFTVSASFLEIYCERVYDLLQSVRDGDGLGKTTRKEAPRPGSAPGIRQRDACDISGGSGSTVTVHGVTCVSVKNAAETVGLLQIGMQERLTAATKCNRTSSRGHAIFVLSVNGILPGGRSTHSQMYLCDLAGSERLTKTGATGIRLVEGAKINTSLLALRQVIHGLAEGGAGRHIPYRDSKLTRLLQNALGGSGRTAVVCTINPRKGEEEEAMSTLRFGTAAATVQNLVKANVQKRSAGEWQMMLMEARAEVRRLKGQLQMCRHQIDCPPSPAKASAAPGVSLLLVCPLSGQRFHDPVVAADGHTYERAWITAHLADVGPVSPVTDDALSHTGLLDNVIIQQMLALCPGPSFPSRPPPTLQGLPDEILRHVFAFLDGRSLARCCVVSNRFNGLIFRESALWEKATLREFGPHVRLASTGTARERYKALALARGRSPRRRRELPKVPERALHLIAYK